MSVDPGTHLEAALRQHIAHLCAPGSRDWGRPKALAGIAGFTEAFFKELGFRVERQQIPDLGVSYANVLAFPPGVEWHHEPWVLAAHYDTVHGTPGADDNASGVAVLMETARTYAVQPMPKRPVVFAALTLEEPPFFGTPQQGGRVLADYLAESEIRIAGALVLEMVGYYSAQPASQRFPFPLGWLGYPDTGNFCGLVANFSSGGLLPDLKRAILAAGLPTETLRVPGAGRLLTPIRFSDHAAFWDRGYRAVMVTDTAFYRNPHYHGPTDLPETLDYRAMARFVRGLGQFFGSLER